MKRSVRPLFSILLLTVVAATLSCRAALRHGFGSLQFQNDDVFLNPPPPQPAVPVFNSTLLKFASIEIGETQTKQEIDRLLEGNFASQGRDRSFSSWRRFNHFDSRARARDRSSSTGGSSLPVLLRSPKFYRYWLEFRRVLHDWSRTKRFSPDIMLQLIEQIKAPIDHHHHISGGGGGGGDGGGGGGALVVRSDQRYSTCAVVGNSGVLLKSEHGQLIDSHEVVIRLNNARIESFERNVGSKTSISFVNSNILHLCARREGCFCHPYGVNVPMILYICQPLHFLDYTLCNSSRKAPLIVTDSRFDVLCARIVKYYSLKRFVEETGKSFEEWGSAHDGAMFHYSSGMQAVMLALGICDKVSVFGFGKSVAFKHHYHTNQKAELRLHDYEAEYDFYRDLVERPQVIPFVSDKFKFPPVVIYQ